MIEKLGENKQGTRGRPTWRANQQLKINGSQRTNAHIQTYLSIRGRFCGEGQIEGNVAEIHKLEELSMRFLNLEHTWKRNVNKNKEVASARNLDGGTSTVVWTTFDKIIRNEGLFTKKTYPPKVQEFIGWKAFQDDENDFFWERKKAKPTAMTPWRYKTISVARSKSHDWNSNKKSSGCQKAKTNY